MNKSAENLLKKFDEDRNEVSADENVFPGDVRKIDVKVAWRKVIRWTGITIDVIAAYRLKESSIPFDSIVASITSTIKADGKYGRNTLFSKTYNDEDSARKGLEKMGRSFSIIDK